MSLTFDLPQLLQLDDPRQMMLIMRGVKGQHITQAHGFIQARVQDGFFERFRAQRFQAVNVDASLVAELVKNPLEVFFVEISLVRGIVIEPSRT